MIWTWVFFCTFYFNVKDLVFISSVTHINSLSIMMCSILPLVIYLIMFMSSYFSVMWEKWLGKFSFLTLIVSVMVCFCCSSSLIFVFFLELTVFPMIYLISFFSKEEDKFSSIAFMVFINLLGSLPFFYFSSIFTPIFLFSDYYHNSYFNLLNSLVPLFSFLLVLLCKIPIFLAHFWLTKAHVSASGSCSMLLASLMLKLGSFGMLKFFPFFSCSNNFTYSFFSLAFSGSLILGVLMTRFFDVKFLVACSSIVHMGMVLPLLYKNMSLGVLSAIMMMVGHGLVSYILFFLVTLMYEFSYSRSCSLNKNLESLSPACSMFLFIFSFLNLGVPPFLNFISELYFCGNVFMIFYCGSIILGASMLTPVIYTMFLLCKSLFGKFNLVSFSYSSPNLSLNMWFFVFISFEIFYLFCFLSLLQNVDLWYQKVESAMFSSKFLMFVFLISNLSFIHFFSSSDSKSILLNFNSFKMESNQVLDFIFLLDWVSVLFLFTISMVTYMVSIYSEIYMESYNNKKFFLLMYSFFFSMVTLICSGSFMVLMVGWDSLGISSICLIMFYPNKTTMYNSFTTMIFNRIGDVILIFLMSCNLLKTYFFFFDSLETYFLYFMVMVCSLTKSAQFPLSSWLPAAMSAPTPISAMVHSSTLVTAGIFLNQKMFFYMQESGALKILTFLSMSSFVIGGALALYELDMKKMIAFSTLSQISMIMILLCSMGMKLSIWHLLLHALFKTSLFCGAGLLFLSKFSDQNKYKFSLSDSMKVASTLLVFSIFSMVGLPFSSSFYSKDLFMEWLFSFETTFYSIPFLLGSSMTIMYSINILESCSNSFKLSPTKLDLKISSSEIMLFIFMVLISGKIFKMVVLSEIFPLVDTFTVLGLNLILLIFATVNLNSANDKLKFPMFTMGEMKFVVSSFWGKSMPIFSLNMVNDQFIFKPSNLMSKIDIMFHQKFFMLKSGFILMFLFTFIVLS